MGLQAELGFRQPKPNALQRSLQRVGASRPGAWLFQKSLFHLDRPLYRWSKGRLSVPTITIGLPVVLLTTTGAKTRLPRTMPVSPVPFEDDLVILGTNFGQPHTPGWVFNLRSDPHATVTWRDRTVAVRAVSVPADDMPEIWDRAASAYAGFPRYRERTEGHRDVQAFVLRPE